MSNKEICNLVYACYECPEGHALVVNLDVLCVSNLMSEVINFFEYNNFVRDPNFQFTNIDGVIFNNLQFIKKGFNLFKIVEISKIYNKFKPYMEPSKEPGVELPIQHSNKYFKGVNFAVDFNDVSFISKDTISLKNGKNVQVQWDNLSEFKLCMDSFIDYLNIPLKNK